MPGLQIEPIVIRSTQIRGGSSKDSQMVGLRYPKYYDCIYHLPNVFDVLFKYADLCALRGECSAPTVDKLGMLLSIYFPSISR